MTRKEQLLEAAALERFIVQLGAALVKSGALPVDAFESIHRGYDAMRNASVSDEKRAVAERISSIAQTIVFVSEKMADGKGPTGGHLRLVPDEDDQ